MLWPATSSEKVMKIPAARSGCSGFHGHLFPVSAQIGTRNLSVIFKQSWVSQRLAETKNPAPIPNKIRVINKYQTPLRARLTTAHCQTG